MNFDFSNKTVVITGGTRGIGAAIVELFQQLNARIIVTGTNIKKLQKLNKKSSSNRINYVHLDFALNESVKSFLNYLKELDKVDILINNAGVNKIDPINKIKDNDWDYINNINLKGPFLLTRAIADRMKKQGFGRLINIASVFGVVSKEKRAAYSTTKWGLIGFTKAVSLDLAPYNILVNAVSPGFVNTELTRKVLGTKGIKNIIKSIPQQRLAEVEEIAKLVIFLASDFNTYITGQNIIVDGGFTSA
jgi:3-oxoacyl-[acyl-carrier protein] reductase